MATVTNIAQDSVGHRAIDTFDVSVVKPSQTAANLSSIEGTGRVAFLWGASHRYRGDEYSCACHSRCRKAGVMASGSGVARCCGPVTARRRLWQRECQCGLRDCRRQGGEQQRGDASLHRRGKTANSH